MFFKPLRVNRYALWAAAIFLCALAVSLLLGDTARRNRLALTALDAVPIPDYPLIILDAGHGGIDGGAVAADGTVEKDLNLAITLQLNDMLCALGCETLLTRESDLSLHDDEAKTVRQKKVSDIRGRTGLVNGSENALLVSIHQNKFPDSAVHGTQVFYSPNAPESRALALALQKNAALLLQPGNKKVVKQAGTDIYLLYHAQKPAAMVECGFLSNPAEREKLKDAGYQSQLAFALACGILEYLGKH